MATVEITVNGRGYNVTCDDGQEERLQRLAAEVDARVRDLAARIGQIGDARLMLLASLTLADDLAEAEARGVGDGVWSERAMETAKAEASERAARAAETGAAQVLDAAADRVRALVASLDDMPGRKTAEG